MTSSDDKQLFYEQLAKQQQWDEFANTFETERRMQLIFHHYLRDVDLTGRELLDGGSGGGHFSAEAVRRGASVTSLDVGEALLEQVARRCDSKRVVGSLLELPFEDGSFDVVLSSEVIEHTTDPKRALGELARVVKPGGKLLVTSPCKLWQPVVRGASALKLRPYQGNENFLWPRTARNVLRERGIEITDMRGFNLLPIFKPVMSPVLEAGDKLGKLAPSMFVNYAVFGQRPFAG